MLARSAKATSRRKANDGRASAFAAKHVAELCHLVDDLIHADTNEIGKHDFRHGPHAHQRRPRRGADDSGFRYGGVYAAIRPAVVDPLGYTKYAAYRADISGTATTTCNILTDHKY